MTRRRPGPKRCCLSLGLAFCFCLIAFELRAETSNGTERFLLGELGVVPGWLVTAQYRDAARDDPSSASLDKPHSQTAVLWVDKQGWLGLEPVFKPHASDVNIVTSASRLSLTQPLKG